MKLAGCRLVGGRRKSNCCVLSGLKVKVCFWNIKGNFCYARSDSTFRYDWDLKVRAHTLMLIRSNTCYDLESDCFCPSCYPVKHKNIKVICTFILSLCRSQATPSWFYRICYQALFYVQRKPFHFIRIKPPARRRSVNRDVIVENCNFPSTAKLKSYRF